MSFLTRWATLGLLTTGLLVAGAANASAASNNNAQARSQLTSSLKVTNAAKSLTVNGHGASAGKTIKIQISAGANQAFGVLTYSGQATTIRRVGTVIYTNSSKGFLQQQGASASVASVEANKWFKVASTNANYTSLNQFLSVSALLKGVVPATSAGTISNVKNSTLNGHPVEIITGTFQGQKGSLYIAKHGTPYLVRVTFAASTGGGSGLTLDLSNYNKPVHTTVPQGAVSQ
jgi:hypothetical protein